MAEREPKGTMPAKLSWRLALEDFKTQSVLLALVSILLYANTFSATFAFDDRMAIVDNEYVQQGIAGIPDILTRDAYESYLEHKNGANQLAGGRYRPLSLITFAIEQQLLGIHTEDNNDAREAAIAADMPFRHVVNVLLYALSLIAILSFVRKIILPANLLAAFLCTLLFAVHPLHTEVVANVKSRDEILSMLFISLTFVKAFAYKERNKRIDLLAALLCYFLALMSKEYAGTMLLLLPLSFYIFRKESFVSSIRSSLPYLAPFIIYLLLRFSAVAPAAAGADRDVLNYPYLLATGDEQWASIAVTLLRYISLLVYPATLAADYSYNQLPYVHFANPLALFSLVLYVGLLVAAILLCRKRHVLGFALAFYLVNLLLVSNLFFNVGAPMGERLVYHSSFAFAVIVVLLVNQLTKSIGTPGLKKGIYIGLMFAVTVLSGYRVIARNRDWRNDETLFLHDVTVVPNSVLVNNNAAAACMKEAREHKQDFGERNAWFNKAIGFYSHAIGIYPGHILSYLNRGLCYYNMGNPEKALPDWDTVRKYRPDMQDLSKYLQISGKYFYDRGMNYARSQQIDSAITMFEKCAEANPAIPDAWYTLATAYNAAGRKNEALQAVNKSLQLSPAYKEALAFSEQLKNAR